MMVRRFPEQRLTREEALKGKPLIDMPRKNAYDVQELPLLRPMRLSRKTQ